LIYWEFLEKEAKQTIENDAPFSLRTDEQGKIVKKQFSEGFLQWSNSHLSPREVASAQIYEAPGHIMFLGIAGDARALPLLRKGLASPNYYVQAASAKGLARLEDRNSIPLIIQACERTPSDFAAIIAEALVFF